MKGLFEKNQIASVSRPGGQVLSCASCGLYRIATNPRMPVKGIGAKKILIIGDAPVLEEDERGEFGSGWQFRKLKKQLVASDIDIYNDCIYMTAVRCVCLDADGKENVPTMHQVNCCRKNVMAIIKEYKPVMIMVLGMSALQCLIGRRWGGEIGKFEKWRGWTIPDQELRTWICPVFHPKHVHTEADELIWAEDIKNALLQAFQPFPDYEEPTIEVLTDLDKLNSIRDGSTVSIDYETTGLKPQAAGHDIICASVATSTLHCYSFLLPPEPTKLRPFLKLLRNPTINKMAHNMKYEDTWTTEILKTPVQNWWWDSMLAAHILDNRPGIVGLKFQTYVNFGIVDYNSEIAPYLQSGSTDSNAINRITQLLESPEKVRQLLTYCGLDTVYQYRLMKLQQKQMTDKDLQAYQLFHDGILAFARAERQGLRIDMNYVHKAERRITNQIKRLQTELENAEFYIKWKQFSKGAININSALQLGNFLYKGLKLKPAKLTSSGNSGATDDEALRELGIPELNQILEIRKLTKVKSTYIQGFTAEQVDGYVHPFFNLHNVKSYRSSSDSPNFQNIPKRDKVAMKTVRSMMFARPGHQLMEVDFSGIEVSVAATYHKDPVMLDYLIHKKDMHGDMAKQIFCIEKFDKSLKEHSLLRSAAKNGFVFPQFYGDYYKNNAIGLCKWIQLPQGNWKDGQGVMLPNNVHISTHLRQQGIKNFTAFVNHLQDIENDFWNNRFKVYGRWKKKIQKEYLENGKIHNHLGFTFRGVMKPNEITNYPVQSAAFHCLLWCFIKVDELIQKEQWDTKLIGQVHDSMVLDVNPKELEYIAKKIKYVTTELLPETFQWINVPMSVDADLGEVDGSWATMKHYEF